VRARARASSPPWWALCALETGALRLLPSNECLVPLRGIRLLRRHALFAHVCKLALGAVFCLPIAFTRVVEIAANFRWLANAATLRAGWALAPAFTLAAAPAFAAGFGPLGLERRQWAFLLCTVRAGLLDRSRKKSNHGGKLRVFLPVFNKSPGVRLLCYITFILHSFHTRG